MLRIFRPWGALVFIAIVALMLMVFWVAAPSAIKYAIERSGTAAVGAKVDVGEVKLTFSPLGLQVYQLEATDPQQPMVNALVFDQADFSVALWPLLQGQWVIEQLDVNNIQLQTARSSSGALETDKNESTEEKSLQQQSKELLGSVGVEGSLPDADVLLAREVLITHKAISQLEALRERIDVNLESDKAAIPDDQWVEEYEQKITAITSGKIQSLQEFNQRKRDLKKLKQSLKTQKKQLQEIKARYQQHGQALQLSLGNLRRAPAQDIASLKEKYALNGSGAANLGRLLLGEDVGYWVEQAIYWYQKAQPYISDESSSDEAEEVVIARDKGVTYHFGLRNTPDLWLKKAQMSLMLASGDYTIEARNFSSEPDLLSKPATFDFNALVSTENQSTTIHGVFDHRDSSKSSDKITYNLTGYPLETVALGSGDNSLTLGRAVLDTQGVVYNEAGGFVSQAQGDIRAIDWLITGDESSWQQVIINGIDQFNFDAKISYLDGDQQLAINSDLDKQLKGLLKQKMNDKKLVWEQQVNSKLNEKIAKSLQLADSDMSQLALLGSDSQQGIEKIEQLLAAKVADYKEQKKQELKNKLQDKLADKLRLPF